MSTEASSVLKFEEYYKIEHRLSKGSFGVVYVTKHIKSGVEYAVKVIERAKLSEKERLGVAREVSILKDCRDVENVVQLVDFFTSPEHFYVVQVYAQGGDVFERLAQRTSYTEFDARNLAKHLLEAIQKIHSRKLAHRDLKPENLLLRDFLDDSSIVVADFGFAAYVPEGGLKTRCGTPAFVGPEVLVPNCRYDERCDNWSVGCLLYMLIAGYPPFQDRNHRGLFKKVRGADYVFHDTYWKNVSVAAKQLIASLLTVDPNFRCTARKALETSIWLTMDESMLKSHDLSASLGEIKKFHAKRTLKGAMHAVIWTVKHKFKSAGDVDSSERSGDDHDKDGTSANLNEDSGGLTSDQLVKDNSDSILLRMGRPGLGFYDLYEKGALLHDGHAKVYECHSKKTRAVFAVKVVERRQRSRKSVKRTMAETVLREVAILDTLKHRNIIDIIEFFEDDDYFYLVMERMWGGDVFDRILAMKRYSEEDARALSKSLLQATAFFHSQNVAHRDLKPQNLLLKKKNDPTDIVISDFGFGCRVHANQSLTTRCGTPSYVAPEVLKNAPYDQSVDMWSIGVILYVLLCGNPPFVDENQTELFRKIRMSEWKFRGEEWDSVSNEAKDLIRGLLVANPVQRLTATQALQCAWLTDAGEGLADLTPTPTLKVESLNQRKSRLKNVVKAFLGKTTGIEASKQVDTERQLQVETVSRRRRLNGKTTVSHAAIPIAPVKTIHLEAVSQPELDDSRRDLGPQDTRKFEC